MNQAELLSSTKLKLNDTVRRSTAQPDRVLLRTAGGERRLVLTPAQAAILTDGFARPCTVPEVLARLLRDHDCPPLNEYYELVLQAHAAGVLVTGSEVMERSLARHWPVRLPVRVAEVLGNVIVLVSVVALALPMAPWSAPAGWGDWIAGWLIACVLLSAGEALAACAVVGGGLLRRDSEGQGAEVRDVRLHWLTVLPHFRIDSAEATMGGRGCELAVAVLRAVPVAVGAAVIAWQHATWLAPVLAGLFYVSAPWSGSAAWQWLGARFGAPRVPVRAGFIFELRRQDAWAQWRAWWAGLSAKFVLLWLGWIILLAMAAGRCLPRVSATVVAWFRPTGGLHPLVDAAIYTLATGVAVAVVMLVKALVGHWWLQRKFAKPLRDDAARGAAAAALQGDTPAVLRQVALFQALAEDDLAALAQAMQPVQVEKRGEVFREDDPGDAFYVVLEGELEILKRRPSPSKRTDTIGWLGPGAGFGEIALLEGTVRTATVRASRPSRLLRLAKADFEQLVVGRVGAARVRELLQHAAFLGRLVFMAGWPFEDLVRYAQRCSSVRVDAGAMVLRRGEPNLWFYLIYDGAFEARDGGRVLRRMQPGDYFGEISLLENGEATADVVAIEESRCLTMGRTDFLGFFAKDYRIGLRMEALAVQRLGSRLFASR